MKKTEKILNTQNVRTRNRKNRSYRGAASSAFSTVTSTFMGAFPFRSLKTFKYAQLITFSNATTVGSQFVFRMNSIFDPDQSGGGHQPYGYDTAATIYARYLVRSFKYDIRFCSAQDQNFVATIPSNGGIVSVTNLATFENAVETPLSQFRALAYDGGFPVQITGEHKLNELNGSTMTRYTSDDRFAAAFGANPTEIMYLYVTCYNPSSNTVIVQALCHFEYEAEVYDPFQLAPSFNRSIPMEDVQTIQSANMKNPILPVGGMLMRNNIQGLSNPTPSIRRI